MRAAKIMARPVVLSLLFGALWPASSILVGVPTLAGQVPIVKVVDIIPASLSDEYYQQSEPNVSVDPAGRSLVAASFFMPGAPVCGPTSNLAPFALSIDAGSSWFFKCDLPSVTDPTSLLSDAGGTGDITLRFSGSGRNLYVAFLRVHDPFIPLDLNIQRSVDPVLGIPVTLVDRTGRDQPYVSAITANGTEHVFVGNSGGTAQIDICTVMTGGSPQCSIFSPLEQRFEDASHTVIENLPPVRIALHPDGTVYAAFFSATKYTVWSDFGGDGWIGDITADLTVMRGHSFDGGPGALQDLKDTDGLAGKRVVLDRTLHWDNLFGEYNFGYERSVASSLSIAVAPNNSSDVWLAWGDSVGPEVQTLHLRRSLDGGRTWSSDLRTIPGGNNPALAVTPGRVGFLYQRVVDGPVGKLWETHFESINEFDGSLNDDVLLALGDVAIAGWGGLPHLGDYEHLVSIGGAFQGVFSSANTLDLTHFPNGVAANRRTDPVSGGLIGTTGQPIDFSVDPFYFTIKWVYFTPCTRNPLICHPAPPLPWFTELRAAVKDQWLFASVVPSSVGEGLARGKAPATRITVDGLEGAWDAELFDSTGTQLSSSKEHRGTALILRTPAGKRTMDLPNLFIGFHLRSAQNIGKVFKARIVTS